MPRLTLLSLRATVLLCGGLLALLIAACSTAPPQIATPTSTASLSRLRVSTITPDPHKLLPPGRTMGDPNAKVTLVVYADFQCPYSKQYTRDIEDQIIETYVKANKINYTYKYFPVIDQDRIGESHWAAYAAECANDQGKFWDYHDKLYYEYRGQNTGAFTRDNLKKYAAELNLDTKAFNTCLDSDKYALLVYDQLIEALQLKLPGTPTFLLNGRKMDTPTLAYDEFWKPIEAELKARQ
jgi:protein-disulfide isomerase